ncbi:MULTISPECIES: hypothetical protein [Enterobacter]|nr:MULTISPECIES: hypothetical protein [Enterobacter]EKS7193972.1 hypothetical protein [Enterobacter ludwigii]EKS7207523.1 hypothetical protein [Enterobacter ludwigii]ELK6311835.1 hypothetical protein [Enterobacter ludwigii]MCE1610958.1 AHH domain-containing protein [Enterobacter ludwigii]MCE1624260.1 AHH domain-containing protein [Enterobacter ludwigii]
MRRMRWDGWIRGGLFNSGILVKDMSGKVGDRLSAYHVIPAEVWKENQSFFNNIGIGKDMDSAFNGIYLPGSATAMKQDAGKEWMFSIAVIIITIVVLSASELLVLSNDIILGY